MKAKYLITFLMIIGACHSTLSFGKGIYLTEIWSLSESLSKPESVIYDQDRDVLYVSNIDGSGAAKDGNGYITKVSMQGKVLDKAWVTGLDAPKGLAMLNNNLYVSDIDELIVIDIKAGKISARHAAEGAQFLNDVAVDANGNVHVSDTRGNRIYRLNNGKLDIWLNEKLLANPNGLYIENESLIMAAADVDAAEPGSSRYLQKVSLKSKKIKALADKKFAGNLDAIEAEMSGGYFLTDWKAGKVIHFSKANGARVLLEPGPGTADLDYIADNSLLVVPVMLANKLIAYQVKTAR